MVFSTIHIFAGQDVYGETLNEFVGGVPFYLGTVAGNEFTKLPTTPGIINNDAVNLFLQIGPFNFTEAQMIYLTQHMTDNGPSLIFNIDFPQSIDDFFNITLDDQNPVSLSLGGFVFATVTASAIGVSLELKTGPGSPFELVEHPDLPGLWVPRVDYINNMVIHVPISVDTQASVATGLTYVPIQIPGREDTAHYNIYNPAPDNDLTFTLTKDNVGYDMHDNGHTVTAIHWRITMEIDGLVDGHTLTNFHINDFFGTENEMAFIDDSIEVVWVLDNAPYFIPVTDFNWTVSPAAMGISIVFDDGVVGNGTLQITYSTQPMNSPYYGVNWTDYIMPFTNEALAYHRNPRVPLYTDDADDIERRRARYNMPSIWHGDLTLEKDGVFYVTPEGNYIEWIIMIDLNESNIHWLTLYDHMSDDLEIVGNISLYRGNADWHIVSPLFYIEPPGGGWATESVLRPPDYLEEYVDAYRIPIWDTRNAVPPHRPELFSGFEHLIITFTTRILDDQWLDNEIVNDAWIRFGWVSGDGTGGLGDINRRPYFYSKTLGGYPAVLDKNFVDVRSGDIIWDITVNPHNNPDRRNYIWEGTITDTFGDIWFRQANNPTAAHGLATDSAPYEVAPYRIQIFEETATGDNLIGTWYKRTDGSGIFENPDMSAGDPEYPDWLDDEEIFIDATTGALVMNVGQIGNARYIFRVFTRPDDPALLANYAPHTGATATTWVHGTNGVSFDGTLTRRGSTDENPITQPPERNFNVGRTANGRVQLPHVMQKRGINHRYINGNLYIRWDILVNPGNNNAPSRFLLDGVVFTDDLREQGLEFVWGNVNNLNPEMNFSANEFPFNVNHENNTNVNRRINLDAYPNDLDITAGSIQWVNGVLSVDISALNGDLNDTNNPTNSPATGSDCTQIGWQTIFRFYTRVNVNHEQFIDDYGYNVFLNPNHNNANIRVYNRAFASWDGIDEWDEIAGYERELDGFRDVPSHRLQKSSAISPEGIVTYTVNFNPHGAALVGEILLTDVMPPGMQLVEGSIELVRANVGATATVFIPFGTPADNLTIDVCEYGGWFSVVVPHAAYEWYTWQLQYQARITVQYEEYVNIVTASGGNIPTLTATETITWTRLMVDAQLGGPPIVQRFSIAKYISDDSDEPDEPYDHARFAFFRRSSDGAPWVRVMPHTQTDTNNVWTFHFFPAMPADTQVLIVEYLTAAQLDLFETSLATINEFPMLVVPDVEIVGFVPAVGAQAHHTIEQVNNNLVEFTAVNPMVPPATTAPPTTTTATTEPPTTTAATTEQPTTTAVTTEPPTTTTATTEQPTTTPATTTQPTTTAVTTTQPTTTQPTTTSTAGTVTTTSPSTAAVTQVPTPVVTQPVVTFPPTTPVVTVPPTTPVVTVPPTTPVVTQPPTTEVIIIDDDSVPLGPLPQTGFLGSSIMGWGVRIIAIAAVISTGIVIVKKKRRKTEE